MFQARLRAFSLVPEGRKQALQAKLAEVGEGPRPGEAARVATACGQISKSKARLETPPRIACLKVIVGPPRISLSAAPLRMIMLLFVSPKLPMQFSTNPASGRMPIGMKCSQTESAPINISRRIPSGDNPNPSIGIPGGREIAVISYVQFHPRIQIHRWLRPAKSCPQHPP